MANPSVTAIKEVVMVTTIGIDPHKATHTAVAIDESEVVLGEITLRADRSQTKRFLDITSVETTSLRRRLPTPHRRPELGPGRHPGTSK